MFSDSTDSICLCTSLIFRPSPHIVTLGNTALSAICGEGRKISEVHGQILSVESENIKLEIFPLFHPASILYRRDLEPDYRADMEKLREKILEN